MTLLLDCQCWVAEETKNVRRKQCGNILQIFLFEYGDMTEILRQVFGIRLHGCEVDVTGS